MTRVFLDRDLDTVATFWRVYRRDGALFAFVSHDRSLAFGGILHRAAPGMLPAAIRMTSNLSDDNAEVEGALSHDSIRADDLSAGLFDHASIEIGAVDWGSLENRLIYTGRLGRIDDDGRQFSAELRSAKHLLDTDLVPRTSPTCRAEFCGKGCGLSAPLFTTIESLDSIEIDLNRVRFTGIAGDLHTDGQVRFLEGPQTGLPFRIVDAQEGWLVLDHPLAEGTTAGTLAELREGCDHSLATCASRFNNAVNFRGEPFLPGNDLLARYGQGSG